MAKEGIFVDRSDGVYNLLKQKKRFTCTVVIQKKFEASNDGEISRKSRDNGMKADNESHNARNRQRSKGPRRNNFAKRAQSQDNFNSQPNYATNMNHMVPAMMRQMGLGCQQNSLYPLLPNGMLAQQHIQAPMMYHQPPLIMQPHQIKRNDWMNPNVKAEYGYQQSSSSAIVAPSAPPADERQQVIAQLEKGRSQPSRSVSVDRRHVGNAGGRFKNRNGKTTTNNRKFLENPKDPCVLM